MTFGLLLGDGGGGGGGLVFGPAQNAFTGTTETLAEAARDTYATANPTWLAEYDATPTFVIQVTYGTTVVYQSRSALAWRDVTPVVAGRAGARGGPGAPGGGAIEMVGTYTGATTANVFVDAGFDWVDGSDVYAAQYGNSAALLWFWSHIITDPTDGIAAADVGDTSAAASRRRIQDTISGNTDMGRTAAGRALVSTTNAQTAVTIRFFRYVPSAAQGGLTEAQVDARIANYARAAPSGQIADAQIPTSIARDAEVTAAITALRGGVGASLDTLDEISDALDLKAPAADPVLTGTPTAPTAANGSNTQQLATTAYVTTAVGATPTPLPGSLTVQMGTSADAVPTAAELTIAATAGVGTVPAYAGSMYLLIARLDSESDLTSVLFSDDPSNTNQIGAFTKYASTVTVSGSAYAVWVSNQALTQTAALTVTAA